MKPLSALMGLFAILLCPLAIAQGALPLKQQEQSDNVLKAIEDAERALDRLVQERKTHCAKAFGYAPFCDCLLKDLPVAWTFSDYVAIVTRPKDENNYSKLDAKMRQAYDMVGPIRDKCVLAVNKKK